MQLLLPLLEVVVETLIEIYSTGVELLSLRLPLIVYGRLSEPDRSLVLNGVLLILLLLLKGLLCVELLCRDVAHRELGGPDN